MNEQYTISNIVDHLKQIRGMSALVLGGSRARGLKALTLILILVSTTIPKKGWILANFVGLLLNWMTTIEKT